MKKLHIAFALLAMATAAGAQDGDYRPAKRTRHSAIAPTKATYAFSPLHVTEENIGLGLSAELFPGKNSLVSIYLPFSIALPRSNDGSVYETAPNMYKRDQEEEMVYFYPGIKIYPTGVFKKVSYAIGFSLAAGVGRTVQTISYYAPSTNPYPYYNYGIYGREPISETSADLSRFKLGAMVTNSLNVRPTEHFYMGIEFGLGYTYVNKLASETHPRDVMMQLGVKFGYAH